MGRIRYQVACSLDGFIASSDGSYDWIIHESEFDFAALFDQFDVLLMGRATYEVMLKDGHSFQGKRVVVLSTTLNPAEYPSVTVIGREFEGAVAAIRDDAKKDVWLFGGGETLRRLLEVGLVDTIEPAIIPVLLGAGISLLPPPTDRIPLTLRTHRSYPSGMVLLEYDVRKDSPR